MSGLTSSFSLKPLNKPLSFNSKPLKSLNSGNLNFYISTPRTSITARFGGGGGGYSRPNTGNYNKGSRQGRAEEDEALDIASLKSDTVRLIDEKQNMVGVVSKGEAIRTAEDAELDLVILSPDADPPVVKLMDYNKYKYELQKKKRDQQKKSAAHRMDLKELKMGYNIDVHDYTVRLKAAQKFLKEGDKVKVIVNLKGRESEFKNNAIELIRRFQTDIGELAAEESKSFRDRSITLVMVPSKTIVPKAPEPPKKEKSTEVSTSV